jgi:hypothetical protein
VRHQEALFEGVASTLEHPLDGQSRGIRGDDRVRAGVIFDLCEGGLLDVHALGHGLDDPVSVGHHAEIVLDIARLDEFEVALGEHQRRLAPFDLLDRATGDLRAKFRVVGIVSLACLGHDVEQVNRDACVGQVGGDTASHDPGTDHDSFSNLLCLSSHKYASFQ